jgi:hypothetical protein
MLDRVSLEPALEPGLNALTARFKKALQKGVEGIIEAGHVLIEAKEGKQKLPHGQFTDWVVNQLKMGERKPGKPEADIRKAEMLMQLARHEVISKSCHWHALPPSPRTLWELTQIRPPQRLIDLINKGKINSGITREEAVQLRGGKRNAKSPKPVLKKDLAALVDACIQLSGTDVVLAHIRGLDRQKNVTVEMFKKAVRWATPKLAKQKGAA